MTIGCLRQHCLSCILPHYAKSIRTMGIELSKRKKRRASLGKSAPRSRSVHRAALSRHVQRASALLALYERRHGNGNGEPPKRALDSLGATPVCTPSPALASRSRGYECWQFVPQERTSLSLHRARGRVFSDPRLRLCTHRDLFCQHGPNRH